MAAYQQLRDPFGQIDGTIRRTADNAFIPNSRANKDWRDYEAWLAEGNTPDPPDPLPATAPTEEDNMEARLFALTERIEACEARLAVLEGSS